MKKSILLGILAFFAISTLSVQNANAQDNSKKAKPQSQTATFQSARQAAGENVVTPTSENAPSANDNQAPAGKKAVKTSKKVAKPENNATKPENSQGKKSKSKKAVK